MSASDKKKLRKEQNAEFLTERQRKEQAETKKLKIYTIVFVSIMIVVVAAVLGILAVRTINNSGVIQKNTIAATVGDRDLNTVELSYYYIDAINESYNDWYTQYQSYTDSYLEVMGLDISKPLNKQTNPETEESWAQHFVNIAIDNAKEVEALYNEAIANDYKLPEDKQKSLDNVLKNIETYASLYGYSNADQYLRVSYGYGADLESYKEYYTKSTIAEAYNTFHEESLSYENKEIREYDDKDPIKFNSYTYHSCYISYTEFLQGGTKDDDGKVTYSDEDKEAARKALKEAADKLAASKDLEELNKLAETINVNEEGQVVVNDYTNQLYSNINAPLNEWLSDSKRKAGDIAAIPNTSTAKDEDGKETTETNGYYVVIFDSSTDNTELMDDVRHLLVKFEGGKTDETTGKTTYTDEEKKTAKTEAEKYLKEWQDGKANEDSFIELVKDHSDDSSADDGGLFEQIHPDSSYVTSFKNWATDSKREIGDVEIIESEYGYHIMYYVGENDMSYRDYMITEELRADEQQAWYDALLEKVITKQGNISKLNLDLVISD